MIPSRHAEGLATGFGWSLFISRTCRKVQNEFRMKIPPHARPSRVNPIILIGLALAAFESSAEEVKINFARQILPILSDACFHCHGPSEEGRHADLRLDLREGVLSVVKPHDPNESEMIRRILSGSSEEQMPPPNSNRHLSDSQKNLLREWVSQGADWSQHWAFAPMRRDSLPDVNHRDRVRQPIDQFVLSKLESEGLSFAPDANKTTWLRRVSFDLTGLPPTIEEIDSFLADETEEAYSRVVDRLFQSSRYGERMASEWLDLARFADTHGYQMDRYRPMWPYRDWIINAFRRNLPYDQFVTWQLAGDLLPDSTQEQRLATAFNRLHMQNEEGGIVEEEFRVAYVVDRVNTFGTAFLGLTFECSRCHDHKYDPITQRDFYSLFAFFQNIDECGQTTFFTGAMPVPTVLLPSDEQKTELARREKLVETILTSRENRFARVPAQFESWLESRGPVPNPIEGAVALYSFDDWTDKRTVRNARSEETPAFPIESPELAPGKVGNAARLDGDNGFRFPKVGGFSRSQPFSVSMWLRPSGHAPKQVVLHQSRAGVDAGSRGFEIMLENGRVEFGLHHMWPGNSLKVVSQESVPIEQWTQVVIAYDGSSQASGVAMFLNGARVPTEIVRNGLYKDIRYGGDEPEMALGQRFRDPGFKGGMVDELAIFDRSLTRLEAAGLAGANDLDQIWRTPTSELNSTQRDELFEYYVARVAEEGQAYQRELLAARNSHDELITTIPEVMGMRELPTPKPSFVLKRGAYDAPGAEVPADTPKFLPPFPRAAPSNRLGLAQWLLDPEHPLMARVTVNRAWQMMFGVGLVETSDNLGFQGSPPSHPELLDWLARDFVASGWNYQLLLRKIALSTTYRQSSRFDQNLFARDPGNKLLGRAPARRLSAEMLRDQALAVSGLLVEKLGGPSVKPYQPPGLWEEIAMGRPTYDQGHGEDLYRRSLYTFWKRTVPHPAMVTFDAADRSVCAAKRQSTSTPLQALALLNDTQFLEASRFLAERMIKEGGSNPSDQLAWAFRVATGRAASIREIAILEQLVEEQRSLFTANPEEATRLLSIGERPRDSTIPEQDLAPMTIAAQAILNHDEAVTRR